MGRAAADTTALRPVVSFKKPVGGLAAVGLAVLVGAAVVYAATSQTGTGSGKASTVSPQPLTITATSCSASGDLYPGGPAAPVCFTLVNPNPYAVSFASVTWLPSGAAISAGNPACSAANVSLAAGAPTTLAAPITVGAGQTSSRQIVRGVLLMAQTAPNACQGTTFSVPLSLNGSQQ